MAPDFPEVGLAIFREESSEGGFLEERFVLLLLGWQIWINFPTVGER